MDNVRPTHMVHTKSESEIDKYLSSPKQLHLQMPLYLDISRTNGKIDQKIYNLLRYSGTIDAYCIWCNSESIFDAKEYFQYEYNTVQWRYGPDFIRSSYECTRNRGHRYYIYFRHTEQSIVKIGQYPSIADFQIPQAEKYRTILGEDRYKELTKAIGLAAHGVGIGSFVYLRRVFEKLIEDAHKEAATKKFSEKKYLNSTMKDKIKMLKKYLPEFLVENSILYGILSKGIHELDESECLKFFDTIRIGIEQILDEKLNQQEKELKVIAAKIALQGVSKEVSTQQKD